MTTKRAILTALDRVKPYLLPEMSLWTDVNAAVGKPVTLTGLRICLQELEATKFVISVMQDEQQKWRITGIGEAELAAG